MEFEQKPDTNTDLNSLCELPEGHKGLHVSYKQGPAAWTGYARHESEPIETKTVTVIEEWSPKRMTRYVQRKDGTRHVLESIENPAIPFVRMRAPREFSEEYSTLLACSQTEQPGNTLPFELLSEQ